ncbi:MAG: chorismate mutase [Methylocystis sp.]|nr:chorismate mutase [Methylocystis sp.]
MRGEAGKRRDPPQQELLDELARVRAAIDMLDDELVALLAKRQRQIERAAAVKPGLRIPARVPERIDEVLARVAEASRREGLSGELAQALWRAIMEWAIAHEERLMERAAAGDGKASDGG